MEISLFKTSFSTVPFANVSLEKMFEAIKEGKFWGAVEPYRRTKDKSYKKKLLCYTPCGVFIERSIEGLSQYNKLICVDIDKKDNTGIDLPQLMKSLEKSQFIYAYHKSVSGEGYAVYIKLAIESEEQHSQTYEVIEKMFRDEMGIIVDKGCKDVCRLRYISADSRLYLNPNAIPYCPVFDERKVNSHRGVTTEREQNNFIFLLNSIVDSGIDITDNYHDWVKIAFGIANALGEQGREYFHSISMVSNKYSYMATEKLYNSAMKREEDGRGNIVTMNTIYLMASDYGIRGKNF